MSSKSNVLPVAADHFKTLRNDANDKPRVRDYLTQIGVPLAVGALICGFSVRLRDLSGALNGVAIFTALLFGMLIFVFQLRMQAATDPRVEPTSRTVRLIDQTFSNVGYACLVGLTLTVLMVGVITTETPDNGVNPWLGGLVAAVGTHLTLVVLMCLKRVRSAYRRFTD